MSDNYSQPLLEVAELPAFSKTAQSCMSEEERFDLITHLALNPEEGVVVQDTGGVRKMRWAVGGKGKSGGVRVIYYYHSVAMPLVAIMVYPKSKKATLTAKDKKVLRQLIPELREEFLKRRSRGQE